MPKPCEYYDAPVLFMAHFRKMYLCLANWPLTSSHQGCLHLRSYSSLIERANVFPQWLQLYSWCYVYFIQSLKHSINLVHTALRANLLYFIWLAPTCQHEETYLKKKTNKKPNLFWGKEWPEAPDSPGVRKNKQNKNQTSQTTRNIVKGMSP